jgi:hypothetical protein
MFALLRRIPIVFVFALVAYISLFKGTFEHIADDPGLGWHLANGSVIAETHKIPTTDPFLALALIPNPYVEVGQPRPWINEQWLGDLALFELISFGGWALVYGVFAGIYLIAYFGIAADSLRRGGEGLLLVLLGVVVAFKLGQIHLIVRPVLFSIVLFSAFIARCRALMTREEWSWSWIARHAFVFGGMTILWANIHPGFVYGLVVLGIATISFALTGASGRKRAVYVAAMFGFCVVASSLNPFGFRLYESIANLGGSAALRSITTEWSPVDLNSAEGGMLLSVAVIPCVCALVSSRIRQGVGLFEVILASVFVLQALWSVRVIPFASLACLPLWSACFGGKDFLPERPWTRLTRDVLGWVQERELSFVSPGMKSSVLIAVSGLIVMLVAPSRTLPHTLGSLYERRLPELFATPNVPQGRIIFASPDWGGAITRLMWPESRAVLDDRTVVVGEALYRAYEKSLGDPTTFSELSQVFGVTDVLAPSQSALANYLREDFAWLRAGESGDTVLFSRR